MVPNVYLDGAIGEIFDIQPAGIIAEQIAAETAARISNDSTESTARANADTALDGKIGTLANLRTTAKNNLVSAINEVDADLDDAKASFSDEIDGLREDIPECSNEEIPLKWIQGEYVNRTTGAFVTSTTWSRTDYIPVTNLKEITFKSSYYTDYNVFYDSNKSFISGSKFGLVVGTSVIAVPTNAAYMALSTRTTDAANTKASKTNTPETNLDTLKSYNNTQLLKRLPLRGNVTTQGITYNSTADGVTTFSGTTSAATAINFEWQGDPENTRALDWLVDGVTYYVKITKTGTGDVRFRIIGYDSNNTATDIYNSMESGSFVMKNKANYTSIYARYFIASGKTVSCSVKVDIFDSFSNQDLTTWLMNGESSHLRLMQNNVGKYFFGYGDGAWKSTDRDKLTNSLLAEKIANYRRMYGDFAPNILFVQEYKNTMTAADETETPDTYPTPATLYDPIFAYNSIINTDVSGSQIFSTEKMKRIERLTITGTDGSGNTSNIYPIFCEMNFRNRRIALISGALTPTPAAIPSGLTYETYERMRTNELGQLITLVSDYDDAIFGLDVNTGTPDEPDISLAENTALMEYAAEYGYTCANCGYFGLFKSYLNHAAVNNNYFRGIDNFLIKGRIKISNFRSLFEETTTFPSDFVEPEDDTSAHTKTMYCDRGGYNKLVSDHVPVIADIYLY